MNRSLLQPKWKNTGLNGYRFKQIEPYISNKKILDLGSAVGYRSKNWMHGLIKEKASSIQGMDIDAGAVNEIRKNGFNVVQGDAQDFNFNDKFEVIHAGELIEHLDNFHGFLQSAKKHLLPGGILVMTTPNGMRISNFIYSAFGGLNVNKEHTCWFCDKTMTTLLERNGFEVKQIDYLKHETKGFFRKIASKIVRAFFPERVIRNTLLVVAKVT